MIFYLIALLAFFLIAPYYLGHFARNSKIGQVLGGIVVCYFIGIVIGNAQSFVIDNEDTVGKINAVSTQLFTFCVLISIPMFLMTTRVKDLFRNIRPVALSFALIATSVTLACLGVSYLYAGQLPEGHLATGMLNAVYIGGSPNLVAVGTTLKASSSLMATIQLTDVVCSSVYLIFMTSIAKKVLSYVLRPFPAATSPEPVAETTVLDQAQTEINPSDVIPHIGLKKYLQNATIAIFTAIGLVAVGLGIGIALPDAQGEPNQILLMSWLSVSALYLSTISFFRNLLGTEQAANYIMLIFALSAGSVIDLALLIEKGKVFLGFNALIMAGAFSIHLLLAKIFRVNVDTFLVGSVASFFGPGFIPQICVAIQNKKLLPAGVAAGVLGLIIATYIGLGVSLFTEAWYPAAR